MPTADARNAFGYTLVIPPGWTRIPLKEGTQDAVKKIVDDAADRLSPDLPRDKVADARLELYRRLNASVKEARQRDGVDLYLPVEPMHGLLIAASIIVTKPETAQRDGVTRHDVLTQLLAGATDSEPAEVDGAAAVRKARTVPADPAKGVEAPSRHVDYVVQVPSNGADSGWLVVSFSTLGDGDPEGDFTEILVELFDAVMTTFRWRTE
ncbi:hypothetical protein [Streptomyces kanamyceticus]|uniref:Uncharacterized protein n=1 Tax=Streptomyces kanamyceticus TaxID=1967 RepID=A0A5J6GCA1_STRKN|nr:hypothetical protein [Streptomyces kanamyceticus]QEU92577.1 hypothetical protein CP970_18190 [Streptomyces kanamyceticus]